MSRAGILVAWAALAASVGAAEPPESVVASGATLTLVAKTFEFTEGPTADALGNVLFSDVRGSRMYRWTTDGRIAIARENTGNANGLAYHRDGRIFACEGGRTRVVAIDSQGAISVIAERYRGQPFNQPNDLWIDPRGGVYFSDPIYGRAEQHQDGEHVYYAPPDRQAVLCVIDDMVRPNGLVGTPDGRTLYVTDHGAKRTYAYQIETDGRLSHKRLFATVGGDGMKLDAEGNLYVAERGIQVYDSQGRLLETIDVPEQPTNLCFAGPDRKTLFITARPAVYTLRLRVAGASPATENRP